MGRNIGISTLLYTLDYLPGVFTLGYQLQRLIKENSKKCGNVTTCVLVTKDLWRDQIGTSDKQILGSLFDDIIEFESLEDQKSCEYINKGNLECLQRPELSFALVKVKLWELTQYNQVIYLDADTLPLNVSFFDILQLTNSQTNLQVAASPDIGWPDMFNSGVMSLIPDTVTAAHLQQFVLETVSIDGSDQGILNQFFNRCCKLNSGSSNITSFEWLRLPFIYNMTIPNYGYQYSPALTYFASQIRLVHFIGAEKPWKPYHYDDPNKEEFVRKWKEIYLEFQVDHCLTKKISDIQFNHETIVAHENSTETYEQNIEQSNDHYDYLVGESIIHFNEIDDIDIAEAGIQSDFVANIILDNQLTGNQAAIPFADDFIFVSQAPKETPTEGRQLILHPISLASDKMIYGESLPVECLSVPLPLKTLESHNKHRVINPIFPWEFPEYIRTAERTFPEDEITPQKQIEARVDAPVSRKRTTIAGNPNHLFDWEDTDYLSHVTRVFPDE